MSLTTWSSGGVVSRSTGDSAAALHCRVKNDARDVEAAWRVAHAKNAVGIYDHSARRW
jgi:hypothetical protein